MTSLDLGCGQATDFARHLRTIVLASPFFDAVYIFFFATRRGFEAAPSFPPTGVDSNRIADQSDFPLFESRPFLPTIIIIIIIIELRNFS